MSVSVKCPNPVCGNLLEYPEESTGKTTQCPACGEPILVTNSEGLQLPTEASEGTSTPELLLPTKELGHYRLLRLLGHGGMGVVYEAMQVKLDRKVALKVLSQHLASDAAYLGRFHREAKAAAALNHPNIVQVHDIGEDKGVPLLRHGVRGRRDPVQPTEAGGETPPA